MSCSVQQYALECFQMVPKLHDLCYLCARCAPRAVEWSSETRSSDVYQTHYVKTTTHGGSLRMIVERFDMANDMMARFPCASGAAVYVYLMRDKETTNITVNSDLNQPHTKSLTLYTSTTASLPPATIALPTGGGLAQRSHANTLLLATPAGRSSVRFS